MTMYNYFCNCCGHRFSDETPMLDRLGLRNDIYCPECGALDIYPDSAEGAAESRRAQTEYEATLIAWED